LRITLNGEPFEVAGPLTVSALLRQLDIDFRRVAVEHNLVVLKRPHYESTSLNEGDEVEIVNFVGGGSRVGVGPYQHRSLTYD
jgi:thiamine biosynthesis protein ThiS